MAGIPPWLETGGSQGFLGAAESGTQSGIQIGEFQQQEKQRALAQAAATAAEHAKLDQTQKIADMDSNLTQERIKSDFLKSMTATNAAQEYRKLQIGLQKDKLSQQAQEASQKFAQSQAREQDVHQDNVSKIDDAHAKMQHSFLQNQVVIAQKDVQNAQAALAAASDKSETGDATMTLKRAQNKLTQKAKDYTAFGQTLQNPAAPVQRASQPPAQASGGLPDLTGVPAPNVGAPATPIPPQGQPAQPMPAPQQAAKAKPSPADIGYLAGHPELKDKFNARFGDGAAESILQQL
jgi:hypothetical protein